LDNVELAKRIIKHSIIMKKKGKELKFISQICRDGSGTAKVDSDYIKMMKNDTFTITCLSLTQKTYIANGFNSFVVKFKTK